MTSHSTPDEYTSRNMHKMHLHDINEDNSPRTHPKDNLLHLTQQVSSEDLKQAIRMELKRLIADHDRHILMLEHRSEILEQEFENLQLTDESYQRRYEKAVREMQFFKRKYDKALEMNKQFLTLNGGRPRSPSLDSHESRHLYSGPPPPIPSSPPPSSISGSDSTFIYHTMPPPLPNSPTLDVAKGNRQMSRSSSSSTSSSNSGTPYWAAFGADLAPSPNLPRARQNSNTGMTSIHSNSTEGERAPSILQGRKGSWQQLHVPSPGLVPVNSLSTPSSPPPPAQSVNARSNNQTGPPNNYVLQQRKVDPLVFGGSDALWDTISKNKTPDATIEKLISNFLRRGGSPNTAKQSSNHKLVKYGYGMLHTLVVMKAISSMSLLLQHGANPNAISLSQVEADKVTPAYLAAGMGWLPGLELLVEAGADLTLARGAGVKNKTALHVAAENCQISVVEYIVSITPPRFHLQVDSMGASALHYACASGHTDLVTLLIQNCHLPIEQADIRGEVPLHWASRYGHLEVASLLVERCSCDINSYVPRKVGTPYDLAKAGNHKRLVEYYKRLGALTAKKMDKKREEEAAKEVPQHLESALAQNGLFGF